MFPICTRCLSALIVLFAGTCQAQNWTRTNPTAVPPTISFRRLAHRVPGAAVRAFRRAGEVIGSGRFNTAAEYLREALRRDPEFAEAHNNLGYCYLHQGDARAALASFQRAVALDPGSATIHVNAAAALFALGEYREAEVASRQAVRLNPGAPETWFALGNSLYYQKKFNNETEQALLRAEEKYPSAKILVADIYLHQGFYERCVAEVREYLATPQPQNAEALETWLRDAEQILARRAATGR